MPKWLKTTLLALLGVLLLRFPPTRMVIIWLLPLGSGWDDVVAIILLLIAGVIFAIKKTRFGDSKEERRAKIDDFFE